MAEKNHIEVNLLGTSFSILSGEDKDHLDRILKYLEKHIEEAKERNPPAAPIQISIMASFYIIDTLFTERKNRANGTEIFPHEEAQEIERITSRLIAELHDVVDS